MVCHLIIFRFWLPSPPVLFSLQAASPSFSSTVGQHTQAFGFFDRLPAVADIELPGPWRNTGWSSTRRTVLSITSFLIRLRVNRHLKPIPLPVNLNVFLDPLILHYSLKGLVMVTPLITWPCCRSSDIKTSAPPLIAASMIIESQKEYPYFSQISIASRIEFPLLTTTCQLKKSLTISFASFLSIGLCIFCTR